MGTVMIRFHEPCHALTCFVGVDVEGIEELADVVEGEELLGHFWSAVYTTDPNVGIDGLGWARIGSFLL